MEAYEYWCYECKQLRLCLDPLLKGCGNCGAKITLKGKPGELDAEKLRSE